MRTFLLSPSYWCSWMMTKPPLVVQPISTIPRLGAMSPVCAEGFQRVCLGWVWWTVHLTSARNCFLSLPPVLMQRQCRQLLETADASFQRLTSLVHPHTRVSQPSHIILFLHVHRNVPFSHQNQETICLVRPPFGIRLPVLSRLFLVL